MGGPGGTLLIVGHLRTPDPTGHGHHPPAEASTTPAAITARMDGMEWEIVTAEDHLRTLTGTGPRVPPPQCRRACHPTHWLAIRLNPTHLQLLGQGAGSEGFVDDVAALNHDPGQRRV
jgi:hypothetical protein